VHVKEAGNSSLMEKAVEIPITTLTTDRHVQIHAFLKKEYPNV